MTTVRKKKIIDHLKHLPAKIACICVLLFQAGVLDYFLINTETGADNKTCSIYNKDNISRFGWPVADLVIVVMFCLAFHASTEKHLLKFKPEQKTRVANRFKYLGELPLGYIAWLLLAIVSTVKTALIFKNVAWCLDEGNFFGPNILKVAVGVTSVIFLLHVLGHHDAPRDSPKKLYIEHLVGGITFDILDSVDHLEILFDERCTCVNVCDWITLLPAGAKGKEIYDLPCSMENAILAFTCINLILPTLPLAVLSLFKFGDTLSNWVAALHTFLYILLVNVPFFTIRMILWHSYNKDISVFLVKNVIMIVIGCMELIEHFSEIKKVKKEKKEGKSDVELEEQGENRGNGERHSNGDGVTTGMANAACEDDIEVSDSNGNNSVIKKLETQI